MSHVCAVIGCALSHSEACVCVTMCVCAGVGCALISSEVRAWVCVQVLAVH